MMKSRWKGNDATMYNTYLYEKMVQNHRQELLHEAEQRRMLAQSPLHQPQFMKNLANRFAAFFMGLQFSNKQMEQPARTATSQL